MQGKEEDGDEHLEVILVESALRLLLIPTPPSLPLSLSLHRHLRRVPVSYTLVSPLEEDVRGHSGHLDVVLDLLESPAAERVDLDQTGAVHLEWLEGSAVGSLGLTTPGDDCFDSEFGVGSSSGLDLPSCTVSTTLTNTK